MKKIKHLILIFCLMLIPAFNIKAIETIDENKEEIIEKFHVVTGDVITSSTNVDGSSFVIGNNVTSENTVKGIDMVLGSNINYTANSDYSLVVGETLNIKGITNNDSFIIGNSITFNKDYKINRDLTVFANAVILSGEIKRDVIIYASNVILEDVIINGNIKIYAANIQIRNTKVDKTLSYNEDATIEIDNNNSISMKETYKQMKNETNTVLDIIINYASVLTTFVVLALIFPKLFTKYEEKFENITISKFISMLGYGLFFLIIVPIIFITLLAINITIPISLLLLNLYVVIICLATILTGYLIGLLIWKKFIKKDINILLVGLLGITIIEILALIPYLNLITVFISILLSLSIVFKLFTKDA